MRAKKILGFSRERQTVPPQAGRQLETWDQRPEPEARIEGLETQFATTDQQIDQLHHLLAQTALNEAQMI